MLCFYGYGYISRRKWDKVDRKDTRSGNKTISFEAWAADTTLRRVIHALEISWIDSTIMSEGITHQQPCHALWTGAHNAVQTENRRASGVNLFQLEKLQCSAYLNKHTYKQRYNHERWPNQQPNAPDY